MVVGDQRNRRTAPELMEWFGVPVPMDILTWPDEDRYPCPLCVSYSSVSTVYVCSHVPTSPLTVLRALPPRRPAPSPLNEDPKQRPFADYQALYPAPLDVAGSADGMTGRLTGHETSPAG